MVSLRTEEVIARRAQEQVGNVQRIARELLPRRRADVVATIKPSSPSRSDLHEETVSTLVSYLLLHSTRCGHAASHSTSRVARRSVDADCRGTSGRYFESLL